LHHAHDGAFRHCSHLHGNSSNDGHPLISALSRISLRLLSREDARRVLNGQKIPGQTIGREYPSFLETDVLRSLIYEQSPRNTPGTFGHYQVEISESSTVIGGAGFLAPPDEFGAVQIDLQIVPDYLGRGYESEIVAELITIARENGALFVIATTKVRELRGQQTLEAGGLDEIVRDDTTVHFGLDLRL
jgi:GNAT superfamily N-acetyltransferase